MALASPPPAETGYPSILDKIALVKPTLAEELKKALDTIKTNPDIIALLVKLGIPDHEIYGIKSAYLVSRYILIKESKKPRYLGRNLIFDYWSVGFYRKKAPVYEMLSKVFEEKELKEVFVRMLYKSEIAKTVSDAMNLLNETPIYRNVEKLSSPEEFREKFIEEVRENLLKILPSRWHKINIGIEAGKVKVALSDKIKVEEEIHTLDTYDLVEAIAVKLYEQLSLEMPEIKKYKIKTEKYTYNIRIEDGITNIEIINNKTGKEKRVKINVSPDDPWSDIIMKLANEHISRKETRKLITKLREENIISEEKAEELETEVEMIHLSRLPLTHLSREDIRPGSLELEPRIVGLIIVARRPIFDYIRMKYPGKFKPMTSVPDMISLLLDPDLYDDFVVRKYLKDILIEGRDKPIKLSSKYLRLLTNVKPEKVFVTIWRPGNRYDTGVLNAMVKNGKLYKVPEIYEY